MVSIVCPGGFIGDDCPGGLLKIHNQKQDPARSYRRGLVQ